MPRGALPVPQIAREAANAAEVLRRHPGPDVHGEAPRRHEVRREVPGGG